MCWFINLQAPVMHTSTLFRFWWHKRGWAGLKKTRQRQMSFGRCEAKTWYLIHFIWLRSNLALPCLVSVKIFTQKLKLDQNVELVEASNLSTVCFKADGSLFQLSTACYRSQQLFPAIKAVNPRPLWLTFYNPLLVEKSDHGRALPAKRTQVFRNSSQINDPGEL